MTTAQRTAIPASQPLFIEAVKTLPFPPQYGNLKFSANGICLPVDNAKDEDVKRYLSECAEKKVIPCSDFRIYSDGSLIGYGFHGTSKYHIDLTRKMYAHGKLLIPGGRVQEIGIDLSRGNKECIDAAVIETLVESGYVLQEGQMALVTQGFSTNTFLKLDSKGGLELCIGDECTPEQKDKLSAWYNKLEAKYAK